MDSLSQIVNSALMEITNGQFSYLPELAITGLLDDFQYAWLKRLQISYEFELLDAARALCTGSNKLVFMMTNSESIDEIREKLSRYIKKWHENDTRVILTLSFDGKKIDAEWVQLEEYLGLEKPS